MSIQELQTLGFVDPAGNGYAFRYDINGKMELCFYTWEGILRLQTKGSGMTIPLPGVKTGNDVKTFLSFLRQNDDRDT